MHVKLERNSFVKTAVQVCAAPPDMMRGPDRLPDDFFDLSRDERDRLSTELEAARTNIETKMDVLLSTVQTLGEIGANLQGQQPYVLTRLARRLEEHHMDKGGLPFQCGGVPAARSPDIGVDAKN
eukprot:4156182-Prymnesium_polylepis.1